MSINDREPHIPREWRRVLAADIGVFAVGIFSLALIPPASLVWPEAVICVLAAFCLLGVITHASEHVHLPGEEYAYLMTGALGLTTLFAFEHGTSPNTALVFRVSVGIFLLGGSVSGYAAHLVDGGRRRVPGD